MSSKARDFYHTQDELNLAWRYLARSQVSASIELDALSVEIESISESVSVALATYTEKCCGIIARFDGSIDPCPE